MPHDRIDWLQNEFDEERIWIVRALEGMIFSHDQNGHLTMLKGDISVLVAAVDLLKRSTANRGVSHVRL